MCFNAILLFYAERFRIVGIFGNIIERNANFATVTGGNNFTIGNFAGFVFKIEGH